MLNLAQFVLNYTKESVSVILNNMWKQRCFLSSLFCKKGEESKRGRYIKDVQLQFQFLYKASKKTQLTEPLEKVRLLHILLD